ncbi:PID-CTERM protein-sorting domain-containing protein [Segetibacter aerophilus]
MHAQPSPGGDPDVPIDGGLSILLAAGVGYVAKKGYEKRKKNAEEKKH